MPSYIPTSFEQQQLNQLGTIGTHPDALATGDAQGKGTGNDGLLNAFDFTAGNNTDVQERASEIAINYYKAQVPYTTPSV